MDTDSVKKTQDKQASQGKAKQVDKSRRAFTRAGMAAPVFLTLASRPVLGAQCLSAMLSGNVSNIGDGSCEPGFGISTWSNPNASLFGSDVVARMVESENGKGLFQWIEEKGFFVERIVGSERGKKAFQWAGKKGFIYGKFQVTPDKPAPDTPCDYTGGTTFSEVFSVLSIYDEGYGPAARPVTMRQILCDEPSSTRAHFVAAMLNAQYVPNYILTPEQVLELWSGMSPISVGITDVRSFLESTWGL